MAFGWFPSLFHVKAVLGSLSRFSSLLGLCSAGTIRPVLCSLRLSAGFEDVAALVVGIGSVVCWLVFACAGTPRAVFTSVVGSAFWTYFTQFLREGGDSDPDIDVEIWGSQAHGDLTRFARRQGFASEELGAPAMGAGSSLFDACVVWHGQTRHIDSTSAPPPPPPPPCVLLCVLVTKREPTPGYRDAYSMGTLKWAFRMKYGLWYGKTSLSPLVGRLFLVNKRTIFFFW